MGRIRVKTALAMTVLVMFAAAVPAQEGRAQEAVPSISEQTAGMEKQEGLFNFYWEKESGRIWLEIGSWEEEFLYVTSMPWGVGSNDIGLDRGQLSGERVVFFRRVGPKVLMMQRNYDYRAEGASEEVARTVEQSFARSVVWGAAVAAEEDGRALVDATDLLMSDAHGVSRRLERAGQGSYRIDPSRSAMFLPRTKNFPDNSEFEVLLTFAGEPQSRLIGSVTPSPEAVTVHQHHSLVRLPDEGFEPRRFDPRSSYGSMSYMVPAAPFDREMVRRLINRHRLEKKNPEAAVSEAVEPIVYYVDPGIPEPVKSAVIEGASWWKEAFEAAGYKDAWQVKELPPEADPMDARYNLIQWVHRSTRGWSYGGSVSDPRTGEIIKAHVTLGSQRIRQDYLIAVALSAPYAEGDEAPDAREMALQRIRQLSAHEVGHTLGLMHNYASNFNERSSVMDYPHPLLRLREDGGIDFSEAYTDGVGEWDKVAIAYGYQDFAEGVDDNAELERILSDALDGGMLFISDADSRPPGSAHPYSHLWDNGRDPVVELERVLRVRQAALDNFSESNIRAAEPLCTLEEVLVPLYLFHRYQTVAAAKVLGGIDYNYARRGDQLLMERIDGGTQRRALEALLGTINPKTLTLPERILATIPPRAPGYQRGGGELFPRRTGVTFDPLSAAETAAGITLGLIFHPERASRLVEFKARDGSLPGLEEVIDRVLEAAFGSRPGEGLEAEVYKLVGRLVVRRIMALAADGGASDQARAIALFKLKEIADRLDEVLEREEDTGLKAHIFATMKEIELFLSDPRPENIPSPLPPPPGEPIG